MKVATSDGLGEYGLGRAAKRRMGKFDKVCIGRECLGGIGDGNAIRARR
jgi:hypothetical protein